ncbi:restriction endonuclease subunit M [Spirosoma luteum]|uniref:restriction endonuclease subunit M n=1 Tax=Spirosoma luteum TaxID=431553 RepID=UPI00037953F5|nr:N-6 DNA methylase [Spirosoma luteum]
MMSLIDTGLEKGYIRFDSERKFITYVFQNKKRNYTNPEEQVQAETFLKLILVYGYPVLRIRQFVTITMGSSTKEADLVVYDDDECQEPKLIVECKKPDVSELEFQQAVEQAFSYAFATPKNVKFIWVTSGIKDRYFTVNKEKDERKDESDIPQFGVEKLAQYKYVKGGTAQNTAQDNAAAYGKQKFFELQTVTESELTRRFRQAHQALWAGGELNPSEAFDELDKLIFCKIWDERHKKRKNGEPYDFQIISEEAEGKITADEKTTAELFKRINALYAEGQKEDPEVFKEDIRLSPQKVKTVVGYLEGINLSKTDLDSKGRAFEEFMGSYFRGDFGQFFTPRNIVKFIVEVMPITNTSRVLDTSCGSGGFLLYALERVRTEAGEYFPNWQTDPDDSRQHYKFWHDFAEKNLYGIEINEQIARTAKMNMIIHDDGHTNVIAADGLLKSTELIKRSGNAGFEYGKFDFIITNPPFGSTVRQAERAYLNQYNFGVKEANWLDLKSSAVEDRANQSTEVLFIEQCHNFLREGGYMAVVIPDGILTNNSLQYVRDQIEN